MAVSPLKVSRPVPTSNTQPIKQGTLAPQDANRLSPSREAAELKNQVLFPKPEGDKVSISKEVAKAARIEAPRPAEVRLSEVLLTEETKQGHAAKARVDVTV